jgi:hypothetical protein
MKNIIKIASLVAIGLTLTPWAVAQAPADQPATDTAVTAPVVPPDEQPTKDQLARLFEAMRLRQQVQNQMKTIPAMIQQQLKMQSSEIAAKMPGGKQLTPEQQAAYDKLMDKYMTRAFSIYPVDEMIADISAVYQRHLTGTDVEAFITFYGSPAGQHLLDAQPAIMQEYMPVVMKRVQERAKALADDMTKDTQEFIKSSGEATDAPAAK